jgi:predicted phage tail protein
MKKFISISGSGGGGKGGGGSARAAQEDPNTLQSIAYAQVLDLISEGEIGGLVDGLKSVYLDETPILNADGTSNFSGVVADSRNGTQHQSFISGFASVQNEIAVGVEVRASAPVVRQIAGSGVNAVIVKISIPQLTYQDPSTGDLKGSRVTYAIEVNANGSGWVQQANDTIIGKCVSKYEKSYRIELSGDAPFQVRVRRVTADSTQTNLVDKTYWSSYTEVIDAKLAYPNSAIVALQVDAKHFSSIPTRGYDCLGIKVQVPSNYNVYAREYFGIWDGTFKVSWTDNPAWIFYDLVTNTRYGLGNSIDPSSVDKWTLYQIAQYCDELVPDGFGGTEPRFSCNLYLQTRAEAYQVIQDLASVFRSIVYWSSGLLTISQDSPADAAHLFTPSNVIDGEFSYQGTSKKNRYSVALVTWNDPDDFYRQKVEYVEDHDAIARYGVVQSEVVAIGCTSRGQAHRFGKWVLYSSQNETETVTFKTGLEAAPVRPGQIIKVQDPMRAGLRMGGRVHSATTNSITVDQDLSIDPTGGAFSISVMLPDGSVQERIIATVSGRTVTFMDLPGTPHSQSVWMISSNQLQSQTFRVVGVTEESGVYQITALAHDPSKYAFIESGINLAERTISDLSITPAAPSGLAVTETLYSVNGEVRVKATFSWASVVSAATYISQYRGSSGNLITIDQGSAHEVEILNIEPDTYEFFVTAVSALGKESQKSTISYRIIGKAYPPADVTGFSLIPMEGSAYLSWDRSPDLDVQIGGAVRIRYSPDVGATWKDSVDIANLAGSSTRAQIPLMNGTYLAKFIDSSGNSSINAAVITTSNLEEAMRNVVATLTESPGFSGVKSSMIVMPFYGGLVLDSLLRIDDVTVNIDTLSAFDFLGGVSSSGVYNFSSPVDLGGVYTSNITAFIRAAAVDVADTIDMRGNVDAWLDCDGEFIDDVNAEIQVQTTEDDPASPSAVWSDWKRFFVGQYKARGLKFRVVASSGSDNHNIIVIDLAVSIDMPDRTVHISGVSSSTSGSNVVFEKPFAASPAIGVTAHNMSSGDYYVISGKTKAGFTITFYDKTNTPISRTFDVIAKGYGRMM